MKEFTRGRTRDVLWLNCQAIAGGCNEGGRQEGMGTNGIFLWYLCSVLSSPSVIEGLQVTLKVLFAFNQVVAMGPGNFIPVSFARTYCLKVASTKENILIKKKNFFKYFTPCLGLRLTA